MEVKGRQLEMWRGDEGVGGEVRKCNEVILHTRMKMS
jgi:hypothetical protein